MRCVVSFVNGPKTMMMIHSEVRKAHMSRGVGLISTLEDVWWVILSFKNFISCILVNFYASICAFPAPMYILFICLTNQIEFICYFSWGFHEQQWWENFLKLQLSHTKKTTQNLRLQQQQIQVKSSKAAAVILLLVACVRLLCTRKKDRCRTQRGVGRLFLTSCFSCKLPAVFVVRPPQTAIKRAVL